MSTDSPNYELPKDVKDKVEEAQKPRKQKQYVYMVVFDPKLEEHFKIVKIEFQHLSHKHPLMKRTAAIFADEEYAKQFYNFVIINAKKLDETRKEVALEQMKQQQENEANKTTLEKLSD